MSTLSLATATPTVPADQDTLHDTTEDYAPTAYTTYAPNGDTPATVNIQYTLGLDWETIEALEELLVTEDDEPVDNPLSEKHQRLSTRPLHASWTGPGPGRPFLAMANVGMYETPKSSPIVPDMFLSLDVDLPSDIRKKGNRAYTFWRYGKAPELVMEIVSPTKGSELDKKKDLYERLGILHYVVFDPWLLLRKQQMVWVFTMDSISKRYKEQQQQGNVWWFPTINLGLTLWKGTFERMHATWLRWCYANRQVVPTGEERAQQEAEARKREADARKRADARAKREAERAKLADERARLADEDRKQADERAKQESERAKRLADQLRALGIDPEE